MDLILQIACAIGIAMILMAFGALLHSRGVDKGLRMARMAWNLKNDTDPLDEPGDAPDDGHPATGECG